MARPADAAAAGRWLVATRFAARRPYTEREVGAVIQGAIAFEDHVTVRRELVNMGLLGRTDDGRTYRRARAPGRGGPGPAPRAAARAR
ncbi:MAG: DUF2087 domain-containing protein [bacterium]